MTHCWPVAVYANYFPTCPSLLKPSHSYQIHSSTTTDDSMCFFEASESAVVYYSLAMVKCVCLALFTTAKTWKHPNCLSTDEWIKKMWYIYTMEYYSAIKMNEIMPFAATWMDLEIIILSEVRQRKTNVIWYHIHMESNDTNELIYKTEADSGIL